MSFRPFSKNVLNFLKKYSFKSEIKSKIGDFSIFYGKMLSVGKIHFQIRNVNKEITIVLGKVQFSKLPISSRISIAKTKNIKRVPPALVGPLISFFETYESFGSLRFSFKVFPSTSFLKCLFHTESSSKLCLACVLKVAAFHSYSLVLIAYNLPITSHRFILKTILNLLKVV